jgi:hypothetical protein
MENFNEIKLNSDDTLSAGGGAIFGNVYPVAYNAKRELRTYFHVYHIEAKLISISQLSVPAHVLVWAEPAWEEAMAVCKANTD